MLLLLLQPKMKKDSKGLKYDLTALTEFLNSPRSYYLGCVNSICFNESVYNIFYKDGSVDTWIYNTNFKDSQI